MNFKLNKDYKLGLRAVKTAISVFLCSVLAMFLKYEADLFCSSVAALMCMQRTHEETIKTGITRAKGTILGGIIGYLALELSVSLPFAFLKTIILPFCILLVIYLCNIFNQQDAVSIACMVVIIILAKTKQTTTNIPLFVLLRVVHTIIGIVIATLVNRFLFSEKRSEK